MNLVLAHEILNVFWMIWDTLLTEEAAAVACDENVVLDTYSTEILVCLQLFIVDEVLVETLSAPFVDECWDEVDSRFVCNNEAFFKSAAHAQYFDVHMDVCRLMTDRLKELGLMMGDTEEAVRAGAHAMFLPHGLGHMMGMDVHDMEGLGQIFKARSWQSSTIE